MIDALFTSTSAVCVTGLIATDIADHFTVFGQAVVAILIQVGGLGVTSIGVGLVLAAGKRVGIKSRVLVKEALNVDTYKGIVRLVKAVLMMTLCFEAGGALLSFLVFSQDYAPLHAAGISLFHSIAAFNNSGFDILGGLQNLIPYQDDVLLNLTTCTLIIFGGLGFLVILDVLKQRRFRRLALHSKVVIVTSLALLAVGTVLLKATEDITWLGAFFQSVSARTAGFSTYPIGQFTNAGLFTLCVLMFIGACAGSTGGGMKCSRILLLFKGVKKEMMSLIHPRLVRVHKMDGQRVQHEVMRSVNAFLVAYLIVIATSILIVSLHCEDMVTSFTSVVTCINNVGPGLNQVGPAANFSALHPLSKIVLTFDMLAGRLELFPMLLLFAPETWRRNR